MRERAGTFVAVAEADFSYGATSDIRGSSRNSKSCDGSSSVGMIGSDAVSK